MYPDQERRSSPRLKGYDYSQAGIYFVTSCLQNRLMLLGEIQEGIMQANPAGQMLDTWWQKLPSKFPTLELDEYMIMPNHLHGLVVLQENPSSPNLSEVMQWFKTMTTNAYIRGVKEEGWQPFLGKFWQRSYYDHIVRNDKALDRIRVYIQQNPLRWQYDRQNPDNNE